MKEYISKDELLSSLNRDELISRYVLGVISKYPAVTKADICREFAEKLKAEVKEQGVKGIIYGDGIDSIDSSFDISKMIDKALAEMEGE